MSDDARNAEMLMRALRGESLTEIGADHGITHERVRQIVKRAGGQEIAADVRKQATVARQKPPALLVKFGLSKDQWRALVAAGVTKRWGRLKQNCRNRSIPFALSLREYATITAGIKIGRDRGGYVLTIRDRALGYVVGNVILRMATANGRATRARDTAVPRTAVSEGVYLLYPGMAKPFVARAKRRDVGRFATADEAIKARAAFLREAA